MKRRMIRIKRARICFVPNWLDRPYPWWFNVKYPDDGMRRVCVPFLTIDILPKK